MSKPLILAGFMGAGKSTIGQLCARQLGYEFVDADDVIVARAGASIPAIFEQKGEAYFRGLEAALVQELSQRRDTVIATGGGMIVDRTNRHALLKAGICVCLTASPEALLARVDADTRPVLRGGDPRDRIMQLLIDRAPAYRELHYTVDTTSASVDDTASRVLALYRAELTRIPVRMAGASYDIVFGEGVIDQLGFALAGRGWNAPFAIVSDDIVGPLHAMRVQAALRCANINAFVHYMPAGESHKTLQSVEGIYRALSEHGVERDSAVIAVGGGVVGDVAGFAAATYLRGVPFVQVPTSLLAMADSSIGGKTGVDTDFGKNLVGAFKQPDLVVMETQFLQTVPLNEMRSGYAEIVKAALISGGEAYDRVRTGVSLIAHPAGKVDAKLVATLLDAIELKRSVVEEDPYEKGRRALLNLGHTFGHGIEVWSRFTIKHGEAVALGMVCAVRLSLALGLCAAALVEDVMGLLDEAGLPTSLPDIDVDAVWQLMQSDKKKRGGYLRFIALRSPGDVLIVDGVTQEQAKSALSALTSNSRSA
ncbi:MAG TPA: 3-dehydroquinate synthase [Anaerolineae bacterium]